MGTRRNYVWIVFLSVCFLLLISTLIFARLPGTPAQSSPGNGSIVRTTYVTFVWYHVSANPSVDKYKLLIKRVADGVEMFNQVVGNVTNYTVNLPDHTEYKWKVKAHNADGWGPWSAFWRFTVDTGSVPEKPVLVSPAPGSTVSDSTTVNFTWNPVNAYPPVDKYKLLIKKLPDGIEVFNQEVSYDDAGYSVPLENKTEYKWKMKAHNAKGWGEWCDFWRFTVHVPIRVEDFGAVGDGITNDGPAIQAAFDAAEPGDIIEFKAKTYKYEVNDEVELITLNSKKDVIIRGAGMDQTILKAGNSDYSTIKIHRCDNIIVKHLQINGQVPKQIPPIKNRGVTRKGFWVFEGSNITFREVKVIRVMAAGILFKRVSGGVARDCKFRWTGTAGINATGSNNITMRNNYAFRTGDDSFCSLGPEAQADMGSYDNKIIDNTSEYSGARGIVVAGSDNVEVIGNTVRYSDSAGIRVASSEHFNTGEVNTVFIRDNTLIGVKTGEGKNIGAIWIRAFNGNISNIQILNNIIIYPKDHIQLDPEIPTKPILLWRDDDYRLINIEIRNNTIEDHEGDDGFTIEHCYCIWIKNAPDLIVTDVGNKIERFPLAGDPYLVDCLGPYYYD
ncbi:MAG: right-handed parallel beta-helix repeat-containing protein [Candidatus Aminicenantia bacterium]